MNTSKNTNNERPPVVVVLGHVDHGKSTLLDYIRKSNTVSEEVGGITQRVAAYEVVHKDEHGKPKKITFLDTPGHEAFKAMRSRSATAADIAILIVSAEDGVQEQTKESLSTIAQQDIPFVVAINKIDKPSANIEKTIANLSEHGVYLEGRGGNTPYATISSKTGEGIDTLLELVLLVAELEELISDQEKSAEGFIIESHRDPQKGISATLLITDGVLTQGMYIATKSSISSTRIMEDFAGNPIKTASASSPIQVVGWSTPPSIGNSFVSFMKKKDVEEYIEQPGQHKEPSSEKTNLVDIENEDENIFYVPIIIKADALGSIDAIDHEIQKLSSENTDIKVIRADVGAISEADVKAAGGDAKTIILGFNTKIEAGVEDLAERGNITIQIFDIIYKLTEWLEKEIEKRKPKEKIEQIHGTATILKTFSKTKKAQVLGCHIDSGELKLKNKVQILRHDEEIGHGIIKEMQFQKNSVGRVEEGNECGIKIETTTTIVPKDTLRAIE